MKTEQYKQWLALQKYQEATINNQMYRAARAEESYGDLDANFEKDGLHSVINALQYSIADKHAAKPNTTPLKIEGDLYNNLASYRDAVRRYRRFRSDLLEAPELFDPDATQVVAVVEEEADTPTRFTLERDMQAALRQRIEQLEAGLCIIDDGAERSVNSGFIDITARDKSGITTVIELKTGVAGQRAVAQILSYMGDLMCEQESGNVRGILVASDFDAKAQAAARVIPNLSLRTYSFKFSFSEKIDKQIP